MIAAGDALAAAAVVAPVTRARAHAAIIAHVPQESCIPWQPCILFALFAHGRPNQ